MNDDFTDALRAVLDNPPVPSAEHLDGDEWTARVVRTVGRRKRIRAAAVCSCAAGVVAVGILVPTVLASPSGSPHHAAAPAATRVVETPASSNGSTGVLESTIVQKAMQQAAICGDPNPTSIQYVRGTRGPLVQFISHDQLDPKVGVTPAVLVVTTGNFKVPTHNLDNPTVPATVIYMIIDDTTGQGLDSGTGVTSDLSPLGEVFHPAVPR